MEYHEAVLCLCSNVARQWQKLKDAMPFQVSEELEDFQGWLSTLMYA